MRWITFFNEHRIVGACRGVRGWPCGVKSYLCLLLLVLDVFHNVSRDEAAVWHELGRAQLGMLY